MALFATEFPVKNTINKGEFVSQVVAWLRGNNLSTVLDNSDKIDLDSNFAHLRGKNGEELILRSLEQNNRTVALGFRHDIPDHEGRLWRTEAVLRQDYPTQNKNFIRFKTQCIAIGPTARTDIPRKPYLIRTLIQDEWAIDDGFLNVSDKPIWLQDNEADLDTAVSATKGLATNHLPIVYISAKGSAEWDLSVDEIEKLAYDLGGVAHVLVEPSRPFAFSLREATQGKNPYGGSIGVIAPNYGVLRKIFKGRVIPNALSISTEAKNIATEIRSKSPASGWDWINLQEESLYQQRVSERNRLKSHELETLYEDEINTKNERIRDLESQLIDRPITSTITTNDDFIISQNFSEIIGKEIYPNEFSDRVRKAIFYCLSRAEIDGLDKRSRAVLNSIIENTQTSQDLSEIRAEIKRATKDTRRCSSELREILIRHGYSDKADNKHIRLEAKPEFLGLETITLSKTPSDHRSLENMRKQVENTLGLTKLSG